MSDTNSHQDSIDLIKLQRRLSVVDGELVDIRNRNLRVESDKAWETGRVRIFSITGITYVTMVLVFLVIGSDRPFVDALVPTTGFFLSTLSVSSLRARLGNAVPRNSKIRSSS
ncbi:MAG: hypothetical protein RIS36_95 [Pseudomonadota bacterium]|jgi:hypothetical protein